jgi:CheY-like chemotaxis protein
MKILLVEDNIDDRFLARRALLKYDPEMELETAADGFAALENLTTRTSPLDLLLLDIQMPKMSGIEVLERLREEPPPHLPPIVVLSASNSQKDVGLCRQLGAVDFLQKPLTVDNVTELLTRLGLKK